MFSRKKNNNNNNVLLSFVALDKICLAVINCLNSDSCTVINTFDEGNNIDQSNQTKITYIYIYIIFYSFYCRFTNTYQRQHDIDYTSSKIWGK